MPKAPSATTSRPALRRNQACKTCRKRKLKCDASRPHCGTCVKQWQTAISVPAPVGYSHPSEPQCSYDPIEGLTLAPDTDPLEKIKELEAEVGKLKEQLFESQQMSAHRVTTSPGPNIQSRLSSSPQLHRSSSSASPANGEGAPSSIKLPSTPMALMNLLSPESPETIHRRKQEFDQIQNISMRKDDTSRYLALIHSGWNPDLPEPKALLHYVETFFRCDPCASHVLHRPSLMANLNLPPRDSNFPHSAILHAICACASRWSPTRELSGKKSDSFAEFHAGKTRQYIDRTMASGDDIFPVMQACTLLSWFFYHEGRWVEVWVFAGFQARVAIPLRLNYPGTVAPSNPSEGQYLPQPKSAVDLEGRRRTWWTTVMFDRMCSVAGWVHAIDEQDIGTEFPSTNYAFEHECHGNNPQDITTPDLFISHPPDYTDSYILLLKAMLLFGRVTDFCVRHGIKSKGAPTRHQDPFKIPGFAELDALVSSKFLENLPNAFKTSAGVTDSPEGSRLDADLYMVRVLPHAATITLHNPYIDFGDSNCVSTARCVQSAKAILNAYYHLSSISVDISRLHPLITICWYLAAAVQVQLCKYFIQMGDTESESAVWGEINIIRFAMLEFGATSPIGTRQESVLQGLMQEIVRTTAQKQPLELGMPLYPFSRNTLWRKDGNTSRAPEELDDDVDAVLDATRRRVPSPVMTLTSSHSPTSTITGSSPGAMQIPRNASTSPGMMNGASDPMPSQPTQYLQDVYAQTPPEVIANHYSQYDDAGAHTSSSSSQQYQQRQQVPLMQQQQNYPAHNQGYAAYNLSTAGQYVFSDVSPSSSGTLNSSGSPNDGSTYGPVDTTTISGMVGAQGEVVYPENGNSYPGTYRIDSSASVEGYGSRWG